MWLWCLLQGDATAVVVPVTFLIDAMESMGLSDDLIEAVADLLILRKLDEVRLKDVASMLREAGVPGRKCLLLQARLTDASVSSPPTAVSLPAAAPVAEAAAKVRVRVHQ